MAEGPAVILHLGLGSFHRAHQAAYLQQLIDRGDDRWFLASGNIRPGGEGTIRALLAQGGRYTLETVTPAGERRYSLIAAIRQLLPWQRDLEPVVRLGGQSTTRIASFTVTQAGYYLDASGHLDAGHPDIEADLQSVRAGGAGATIYGTLAALLRRRSSSGAGPLTLLSCDSIPNNGERSRGGLLQFIELLPDPALLSFVRSDTTSPNSTLDRITLPPTPELCARVREATGMDDAAPVMSEAFTQWVIENRFANARPDLRRAGVQIVPSVVPYEEARIRILNACKSAVAWTGALLGRRFIHETAADPRLRALVQEYVDDVIPCLLPSPVDLEIYRDLMLKRLCNAALMDTVEHVAQDSYVKLQGCVAPTLCERLRGGGAIEGAALLPALFLGFLECWRRGNLAWRYEDSELSPERARALTEGHDPVAALCGDRQLWGDCAGDERLYAALSRARRRLDPLETRVP